MVSVICRQLCTGKVSGQQMGERQQWAVDMQVDKKCKETICLLSFVATLFYVLYWSPGKSR